MIRRIFSALGRVFRLAARSLGIVLERVEVVDRLVAEGEIAGRILQFVSENRVLRSEFRSQLGQDLLALVSRERDGAGFFVEFGACDGVTLSNTYVLEKEFGWTGILAEPARIWHSSLAENRSSHIDHRAVWIRSGEHLAFKQAQIAELSTFELFTDSDAHSLWRQSGESYEVETVSLQGLLAHYEAPRVIDFVSIDTEGSEFAILSSFDFDEYQLNVITVEHNGTEAREKISELLTSHGYVRVFGGVSRWDDWYFRPEAFQAGKLSLR